MALQFLLVAFFASVLCTFSAPLAENSTPKGDSSGRGTWFDVGLGACGHTSVNSDFIVALPASNYDGGSHCGDKIKITSNGKSQYATVEDLCPSCAEGALDMSPSLFEYFASLGTGVISVQWEFV
jgi:hypothetical protein